jgi:hypothetical protein
MCSILQKNFGWPSTGTHRCYNRDCDKIVECVPYNSALCSDCHPRYHKSECSHCKYDGMVIGWGSSVDLTFWKRQLDFICINSHPLTDPNAVRYASNTDHKSLDLFLLGPHEIPLRSQRRQKNRINKTRQ